MIDRIDLIYIILIVSYSYFWLLHVLFYHLLILRPVQFNQEMYPSHCFHIEKGQKEGGKQDFPYI